VEGWKRYWTYFRFLSGRKWVTRQCFDDNFCSASRRWWTSKTSSYRGGIGWGTRDRPEFYFLAPGPSSFPSPLSSSNRLPYVSNQIKNQLRHKIGREHEPATQSCLIRDETRRRYVRDARFTNFHRNVDFRRLIWAKVVRIID